jgi:hypothetical protein
MELSPSREAASRSTGPEYPITRARHWPLSWARWTHFSKIKFIIILPPRYVFLMTSFLPDFPPKSILYAGLCLSACYMPCPSRPYWLDHSSYIWRRLQVTKHILQFFPSSHYFKTSWAQIFSSATSSHIPSVYVLPSCHTPTFTPIQTYRQTYSLVCLIFRFLSSRREGRSF